MFNLNEFHWNTAKRCGVTQSVVGDMIKVLNTLTPEQEEAVRLYARQEYESGWDAGQDAADYDLNGR